jgi:hypothetical protein
LNPQDWVRVGAPLVEQDAEFLHQLIRDAGHPAKLKHLPDIDDGRSVVVLVRRENYRAALALRARHYTDPTPQIRTRAAAGARTSLLPLFLSAGGFIAGAPLGWMVRGSVLVAMLAGAGVAVCGLLLALAVSVGRMDRPSAAPATTSHAPSQPAVRPKSDAARRDGEPDENRRR